MQHHGSEDAAHGARHDEFPNTAGPVTGSPWRAHSKRYLETGFAFLAIGGATAAVLADLPLRSSASAASDWKTLYASAWCLRHGQDAYLLANLEAVFRSAGVVAPATWFGHAPVYPPFTLAVLAPVTFLAMPAAAYLGMVLSALVLALAVAALLQAAEEQFALPFRWRLVALALCAANPLVAFGLSVGNLSVAASALTILAFLRRGTQPVSASVALAAALLLKPHLAVWVLLTLFLLPQVQARTVAWRALLLSLFAVLGIAVAVGGRQMLLQTKGFLLILATEGAPGGSMHASSREPLPVPAQITSLRSLAGFWTGTSALSLCVTLGFLAILGLPLLRRTLRAHDEQEAWLVTGCWLAFGLLATYHRAHDAIALLLLLPPLLHRVRCGASGWQVPAAFLLYLALALGPRADTIAARTSQRGVHSPFSFVLLRQAAIAELLLTCTLLCLPTDAPYGGEAGKAGGAHIPDILDGLQRRRLVDRKIDRALGPYAIADSQSHFRCHGTPLHVRGTFFLESRLPNTRLEPEAWVRPVT